MKQVKVFLSPSYQEESFYEEVSGILFTQGSRLDVHSITLADNKLAGIQKAILKNILLPYDYETRDFMNSTNHYEEKAPVKVEEPVEAVEKEEVKVEVAAVEEPAKKTRKRTVKKEETK